MSDAAETCKYRGSGPPGVVVIAYHVGVISTACPVPVGTCIQGWWQLQ